MSKKQFCILFLGLILFLALSTYVTVWAVTSENPLDRVTGVFGTVDNTYDNSKDLREKVDKLEQTLYKMEDDVKQTKEDVTKILSNRVAHRNITEQIYNFMNGVYNDVTKLLGSGLMGN